MKITVLGAGTWGTALTILLASNHHEVTLWSFLSNELSALEKDRTNIQNLPGAILPESVLLEPDLTKALKDSEMVVMAVASVFVRETSKKIAALIPAGTILVNVAKGIEEASLKTLTEVMEEEIPQAEVAVLSGPSHAEELSKKMPTTIVAGAGKKEVAERIQDAFMTDFFRVYTSPDVIGIELGGSLKNVIALAAGITDGLGFGDNTKAALMTRGIAEISRLGVKMGGKYETFSGLSGMGDLMVTCTSLHSRNRNAGYYIGQGMSADEAMKKVNQVVEGVYSARAALLLAQRYQVTMPIVEQINLVLFENKSAKEAALELFARDKTEEHKTVLWKE